METILTNKRPAWNKGLKGLQSWMNISGLNKGEPWNKGKNTGNYGNGFQKGDSPVNKGVPMSDAQKKKLSDAKTGTHRTQVTKDKISKYFLSHPEIAKGRKLPKGENHHNWKGGISKENDTIRHSIEGNLWRNSIFARDGYACQKTAIKGGKLVAHHILNFAQYPELRFAIDNGITLSEKAHKEFHKKYGIKNNTLEQLSEFLAVDNEA